MPVAVFAFPSLDTWAKFREDDKQCCPIRYQMAMSWRDFAKAVSLRTIIAETACKRSASEERVYPTKSSLSSRKNAPIFYMLYPSFLCISFFTLPWVSVAERKLCRPFLAIAILLSSSLTWRYLYPRCNNKYPYQAWKKWQPSCNGSATYLTHCKYVFQFWPN